ncbi:MAG: hypothetical protein HYY09_05670 [Firmicutes bacterium]|nr:hypothetical protein [Bacillota bacterium]
MDSRDEHELSPGRREELLQSLARRVGSLGLATPALFLLHSHRPLSFLGSQSLFFFAPILGVFFDPGRIEEYGRLLSDRGNIDRLIELLEQ